jgi:tetratricopeptide (TPR) repeat protein
MTSDQTDVGGEALAADLDAQVLQALAEIRAGDAAAGLQRIAAAEAAAGPALAHLPGTVRYLLPFVRARAYFAQRDWNAAQTALDQAATLAEGDDEATVKVRNLLGGLYLLREQPDRALAEHERCAALLRRAAHPDRNLQLSVYHNLALDYWALHDHERAIAVYHQSLALLEDLADPLRQAAVCWGLLMAYRATGDSAAALLYGMRALPIYSGLDRTDEAAGVAINIAEILLDQQRYAEAESLLQQAQTLAQTSDDAGLHSFLYGDWADLALQQGDLDRARAFAAESLACAEANRRAAGGDGPQPLEYPTRTYVEALQLAALVEEAAGRPDLADALFAQATAAIEQTTFDDTAQALERVYADVLHLRGAFEQSVAHYRRLARFRPRSRQAGP